MDHVFLSLFLIGGGIFMAHETVREYLMRAFLLQHGVPAEGQLVDLAEQSDAPGTTYFPVVRFTPHAQPELTARCDYSVNPKLISYDEWLPLRYHPDQPRTFLLIVQGNSRRELYSMLFWSAVMLSLGGCILILGLAKFLIH